MTTTPRIDAVQVVGDTVLLIQCKHMAEARRADLAGWIATGGELLAALADPKVFATAHVAEWGTAIGWAGDDDLMIDAEHVCALAREQLPFLSADLLAWQKEAELSNQEAADFLGIALSTWNAYRAGATVPNLVAVVCRAAQRDPLLMQAHYRPRKAGRPRKAAAGEPA